MTASAEDKASLVWLATWRGKRTALDNEQALELAESLEWAASWRGIAETSNPRSELVVIARRATKLAGCLETASQNYPVAFMHTDLPRLIRDLESLQDVADHPWVPAVMREAFRSPERLFIKTLGDHYLVYSKQSPKLSRTKDGTLSGPFLRFVQEASRQFCPDMTVPSSGVIRKTLEDARLPPHMRRTSIATPERKKISA